MARHPLLPCPLPSQSCNLHNKMQRSCRRLVVQAVYSLHLLKIFSEFLKFMPEKEESGAQQRPDRSSPMWALRKAGNATSLLLQFILKQELYLNNHVTSPAAMVSKYSMIELASRCLVCHWESLLLGPQTALHFLKPFSCHIVLGNYIKTWSRHVKSYPS